MILTLLVTAIGAGQSLLRREPWTLAHHITTTRLGLIIVWSALVTVQTGFSWPSHGHGLTLVASESL